jgi:hypothetical protein
MFFLFARCTLMGSLGISFDKRHYCCIYDCVWTFNIFCIVFCVQRAIFISMFLKSMVILTFLPRYVKVAHFVCGAGGQCVCFVFIVVEVIFRLGLCYICYFVVCFNCVYFCLFCSFGYWICA